MLREGLAEIGNPNTWVIASAGPVEFAEQGVFAQAFRDALQRPRIGPSQRFIGLDSLVQAINDTNAGQAEQRARVFSPPTGSTGIPPFFPNKDFAPGLAGLTVDEQHWLSRARAGPAGTTIGSYLMGKKGRILAAKRLATWMTAPGPRGLAVVTGSPGTGKSALLSLPVLLTQRALREDLLRTAQPGSLVQRTADLLPVDTPLVAVHARGLNTDQAAGIVAQTLGRDAVTAASLLKDLDSNPVEGSRVVVVDAADEATSPDTLLDGLVLPLARQPGLQVVVGARPPILSDAADADLMIDLDTSQYKDPQALTDYIYQLLIAANEPGVITPYQIVPGQNFRDEATEVAAAIARQATARKGGPESFLLGRLLALSARGRTEPVDVTGEGWQTELPASVAEVFDEDLARFGDRQSVVRTLLTTLAWAKGAGLPWENIWAPAARAVAQLNGETGHPLINDDAIRWLLRKAGAFIVEDLGPGDRSVYRPFHDLLATHLRGEPSVEQRETGAAEIWEKRRSRTEATITRALLDTVPPGPQGRPDWLAAHPYLITYLAQHAAAAGTGKLAELAQDMDFLAVADPVTLTPLLSPTVPQLGETAHIYRRAQPLLGDNASANAAYLAEAHRALTGSAAFVQSAGIPPLYRTRLASVSEDDSLLAITAHVGTVTSVAFGVTADRRFLLAAGGEDGTVRLWDPVTGRAVGEQLDGHAGTVEPVAFGTTADGRLLLAFGGRNGTVRLWDPVTGTAVGKPLGGHTLPVASVAFGTTADGRLLLASGGRDGRVRLWDPVTGTAVGKPLGGHIHPWVSVAFGTAADGRLLLAAGGQDGAVRLWEPVTGRAVGKPLPGDVSTVASVAFGAAADGRLLVAFGDRDGTVRLRDPVTCRAVGKPLAGDVGTVESVAFGTTADGRLLLASGGQDGRMRLWDPITRRAVGKPLAGHVGTVASVAFGTTADGRLLLASGGQDGTVRLWRSVTSTAVGKALAGHTRPVASVAFGTTGDGRLLLASGGQDGTVRLWDPVTGTAVGEPLAGHAGTVAFGVAADRRLLLAWGDRKGTIWLLNPVGSFDPVKLSGPPLVMHAGAVASMAFGTTGDGRLLLASGGQDGRVRLWDPVTGTAVGEPLGTPIRPVVSVAFGATGDGRLLLACGDRNGTVRLWDPVTGRAVGEPLIRHKGTVESVAFGTATDRRLVLASGGRDGRVQLWDPIAGEAVGKPLAGDVGTVASMAFGTATDGRLLLAFGGRGRMVRLWDVARKECVLALRRRSGVQAIAVSGPLIAIGDQEGVSVIEPRLASGPVNAEPAPSSSMWGYRARRPEHAAVWIRIDGTWRKGRITAWFTANGTAGKLCQIQAERSAERPRWSGRYVYDPRTIQPRHGDRPPPV